MVQVDQSRQPQRSHRHPPRGRASGEAREQPGRPRQPGQRHELRQVPLHEQLAEAQRCEQVERRRQQRRQRRRRAVAIRATGRVELTRQQIGAGRIQQQRQHLHRDDGAHDAETQQRKQRPDHVNAGRIEVEEGVAVAVIKVGRPPGVDHTAAQQARRFEGAEQVHLAVGSQRRSGAKDGGERDQRQQRRGQQPGVDAELARGAAYRFWSCSITTGDLRRIRSAW